MQRDRAEAPSLGIQPLLFQQNDFAFPEMSADSVTLAKAHPSGGGGVTMLSVSSPATTE